MPLKKSRKYSKSLLVDNPKKDLESYLEFWHENIVQHKIFAKKFPPNTQQHFLEVINDYQNKMKGDGGSGVLGKKHLQYMAVLKHINSSYLFNTNGHGLVELVNVKKLVHRDSKSIDDKITGIDDTRYYCGIDPYSANLTSQVNLVSVSILPRCAQVSHHHFLSSEYILFFDPTSFILIKSEDTYENRYCQRGDLLTIGANVQHTLLNENYYSSKHVCIRFPIDRSDRNISIPKNNSLEYVMSKLVAERGVYHGNICDDRSGISVDFDYYSNEYFGHGSSEKTFVAEDKSMLLIVGGDFIYRFGGNVDYRKCKEGDVIIFNTANPVTVAGHGSARGTKSFFVLNQLK